MSAISLTRWRPHCAGKRRTQPRETFSSAIRSGPSVQFCAQLHNQPVDSGSRTRTAPSLMNRFAWTMVNVHELAKGAEFQRPDLDRRSSRSAVCGFESCPLRPTRLTRTYASFSARLGPSNTVLTTVLTTARVAHQCEVLALAPHRTSCPWSRAPRWRCATAARHPSAASSPGIAATTGCAAGDPIAMAHLFTDSH
jgi:hypothetical protein